MDVEHHIGAGVGIGGIHGPLQSKLEHSWLIVRAEILRGVEQCAPGLRLGDEDAHTH